MTDTGLPGVGPSDVAMAQVQNTDNLFPRYVPELETIKPDMKEILVKAGVPEDQLKAHIMRIVSHLFPFQRTACQSPNL